MKTRNRTQPILNLGGANAAAGSPRPCFFRPRVTQEQKFIQLHHVANIGAEAKLKKGDTVAMVCTKCKTVLVSARTWRLNAHLHAESVERLLDGLKPGLSHGAQLDGLSREGSLLHARLFAPVSAPCSGSRSECFAGSC
jgi:hypothetical protein